MYWLMKPFLSSMTLMSNTLAHLLLFCASGLIFWVSCTHQWYPISLKWLWLVLEFPLNTFATTIFFLSSPGGTNSKSVDWVFFFTWKPHVCQSDPPASAGGYDHNDLYWNDHCCCHCCTYYYCNSIGLFLDHCLLGCCYSCYYVLASFYLDFWCRQIISLIGSKFTIP